MTDTTMTETPDVERELARDMIVRALPACRSWCSSPGLTRGGDGALSAAFAIAFVLANFILSAALLAWAARISPAVLMAAALCGFLRAHDARRRRAVLVQRRSVGSTCRRWRSR